MDKSTAITGLIMAGGRGMRMGGVDKGLQRFRGLPMVVRVIGRLKPQVDTVILNANQNLEIYSAFGLPVFADAIPDFAGPLAAVQSGLMHCTTPYMVTVPCDSPFLPSDLVARLYIDLLINDADVAFAVTGSGTQLQKHPVFSVVKTTLLPQLNTFLATGKRRIDAWHTTVKSVAVHFEDEQAFDNINTPEDLKKHET
ncbi:MAG: molybdenum cofactor guanylyltransferase MobA [Herminiimonas sp.]|nr:molybdenum cofactor guanylyltransferase MobA [Herminiimonas sp.]